MKLLNPQNIITILACVGVFFISRIIVKSSMQKEINRLDKKVSLLQDSTKFYSSQIVNYKKIVFDLTQTIDASKANDAMHQSNALQLRNERDSFKQKWIDAEKFIKCMEESGQVRYFVKPCLSSWYIEQKEKPNKIKQLKD